MPPWLGGWQGLSSSEIWSRGLQAFKRNITAHLHRRVIYVQMLTKLDCISHRNQRFVSWDREETMNLMSRESISRYRKLHIVGN
jgi:hypothetical protein